MFKWFSTVWWVLLLRNPHVYLFQLLKNTVLMGIALTVFYVIMRWAGVEEQKFGTQLHTIIGLVIGLLLVFRTNSAYERWWDARKLFASLSASFISFRILAADNPTALGYMREVNGRLFPMLKVEDDTMAKKMKKEIVEFMLMIHTAMELRSKLEGERSGNPEVRKLLGDVADKISHLERIRDTPIPLSYTFHIKVSVFAYLLSLPFGIFFGMGAWSIPMVMVLFFIIAGIEIISTEIENPFHNDPNDLPIGTYERENNDLLS